MRHRRHIKRFNRTTAHRLADGRNLVSSLFRHGRIVTTVPKAKEYRRMAERLITMAKKKDLHNYRRAISILQDKEMAKKLFDEIAPVYQDRPGGYTRILRLSKNRLGDNAPRALFELVDFESNVPDDVEAEAPKKKRGLFGRKKDGGEGDN